MTGKAWCGDIPLIVKRKTHFNFASSNMAAGKNGAQKSIHFKCGGPGGMQKGFYGACLFTPSKKGGAQQRAADEDASGQVPEDDETEG
jgi:hypothetical protein